jgi:putative flippase GtrA
MSAQAPALHAELGRLLRFALVGVSNTALTLITYTLLTRAGVAAAVASALGFAVGAANGYRLNRRWTFHATGAGGATVVSRYVAVQALGAGLSAGGVALVTAGLSLRHLPAELLVLPLVTLITYILVRRVVFEVAAPA